MGIYIKGMKMPETCDDCPFPYVSASYDKYMECPLSKDEPTALKRNDDCPLTEVEFDDEKVKTDKPQKPKKVLVRVRRFVSSSNDADVRRRILQTR